MWPEYNSFRARLKQAGRGKHRAGGTGGALGSSMTTNTWYTAVEDDADGKLHWLTTATKPYCNVVYAYQGE